MRVIAGAAKGRRLVTPRGPGTRPTPERVREALFSSLQSVLPAARVVDLYAGSGALGIEALSRGAATATFVEVGRAARKALESNLERTGLADDAVVLPGKVRTVLRGPVPGAPFDLALLDPPYDLDPHHLDEVLRLLVGHLADEALVVLERGRHSRPVMWPEALIPERERRYGDTVLMEARLEARRRQ